MRKGILGILAFALLVGVAWADVGDLVASFPNVGTSTHYGLAADANYLYSYYYYSTYRYPVIRMRRTTGSFVSSYPVPGPTYPQYTRGMCYDGLGYIYGNNYSRRYVTRFRASNGSLVSTWTWPSGTRYGIGVDHNGTSGGTYLYQSYYNGDFWKNTLSGSLVSSWSHLNYTYAYDLAWDYGNDLMWFINYSTDWVQAYNVDTRRIVESFRHPRWSSISSTYGIAYWGNYLYISNSGGTPDEYIWVFHCPANVTVAPASVGKVKALFQ